MSNIIWYLIIGLALVGLYEFTADRISSENKFTHRERILVILIWPITAFMFVWAFIKTLIDNDSN
jgi:hypothetical protein